jgi:hypothetical protein
MLLWLISAPYGPRFRKAGQAALQRAVRGFSDFIDTIRDIAGHRILISMILLAGVTSFLVGNAYHPQMPAFAADLGHGENGVAYSALLAADAFGAILAGFALEYWRVLDASPRTAIALATLWALALLGFALAFNTMAQTLVQLNAPTEIRGRVIGLFNMASLGMRAFSGITVGVVAVWTGIHVSLGLSAALVAIAMVVLFRLVRQ